jgi:short-subunit dehydrogenase
MNRIQWQGTTALVTGASSGLGAEFAKQIVQKGARVVLVARREDKLRELAVTLGEERTVVMTADLRQPQEPGRIVSQLEAQGIAIDHLINNAGSGRASPFVQEKPEMLLNMVRLNCSALLELTSRLLPPMVKRKSGGVIQVASLVAMNPCPYQSTYAATKAFVLSLTEGLAVELRGSGVRMTALCPGHVRTGFQVAAGFSTNDLPVPGELSAEQTVAVALRCYERGKTVAVPGCINKLAAFCGSLLPRSVGARPSARRVLKLGRF